MPFDAIAKRAHLDVRGWLRSRLIVLPIALVALFIVAMAGHIPQAGAASGQARPLDCAWTLASSPNTHQYNSLNAVAVISANDAWAVGSRGDSFTGELTLI